MNNEQFRRLVGVNSTNPSSTENKSSSSTPSHGVALGSRQKRAVAGLHKNEFARQLAQRDQSDKRPSKFRSSVPKGSKVAQGYVDRAQARESAEGDERVARLEALEEALKKEEIDQATYDRLRSQVAGGDLSSTHLVKGLDFALLARIRQGEDVYGDNNAQDGEQHSDVDDELDRLEDEEITTLEKEKTKKKGHLSTEPSNPSRKRTRDQILADMKAARDAAKAKQESSLGSRFKKLGVNAPGTRIERDSEGREVMIITDEDGNEKRKVRKVQNESEEIQQKSANLMRPDPKAKPLGMEVPDMYKPKAEESDDEDVNIFDDVGDDYDPLAGLDEDSDGDDKEEPAGDENPTKDAMPPPPKPIRSQEPRNYFKDSKTALASTESLTAPSMSDPAIQAAIRKAASLQAISKASEEDDEEARAKAERRRKMLENNDRDAEDMDMGFGMSRFEDEADFEEKKVKLSEWDRDDEGDDHHARGSGSKRKRAPKKRKGDGNNAADDVFAILLGAYHPGIRLLGISTVHGNASLDKTTNNALSVLSAIGKADGSIYVHPGAAKALCRDPFPATAIHGESGLDGTDLLPAPETAAATALVDSSSIAAVDAMAAALRSCPPDTAWVTATGALTNVAMLFKAHPDLRSHIAGLSIMGGSIGGGFTPAVMGVVADRERVGNYTQWAEFNIVVDPEAAAQLLHDPVLAPKTTLVPLDLTHLVLATPEIQGFLLSGEKGVHSSVQQVKAKSVLRQMLVELLTFFASTYRDVFGIIEGPPLHDPLAVAAILTGTAHGIPFYDFDATKPEGPERRERFEVRVVTEGTLEDAMERDTQTGRTVARLLEPGEEGIRIPRGLDIETFWKIIEECCQRADEVNAQKRGNSA
ncbi:inosine-uridine preferring nucleoside hydrolase-domain-containing protein [Xylariaceae sp. FL0255]|nr:inosine-uridine preferring nucleoside hydrolase-domain-containing protein [Xylariaceae sp. FL0255]